MMSLPFTRGARLACALACLCALALQGSSPALAAGSSAGAFSNGAFGANKALHLSSIKGQAHVSSGSMSGTIVRTIVGLLIVIAVIYGITWLMRQARAAKNPSAGYGLTQIATLALGTNRSVSLVRVGAELHMLGLAEHGITSIRVFSEEEAYELGLPFEPEDGSGVAGGGVRLPLLSLVDSLRRMTVR